MGLRNKQSLFVKLLSKFLVDATEQGYEFTFGDAARIDKRGHMPGSLHYVRLAMDLNLFVDGEWISDGSHPAWEILGKQWEEMHPLCAWGGRFGDANHFSLRHGGKQ